MEWRTENDPRVEIGDGVGIGASKYGNGNVQRPPPVALSFDKL